MTKAKSIMLQGTSSDVGKSVLCTALCRIFKEDGFSVAPFKAQNMALNSYITPEGGEIGRAQGVQAEAAGIMPTVLMNPILLKPKQDLTSQVVVKGRPLGDMSAKEYRRDYLPRGRAIVEECLAELREQYEVLVIEGAGSPAEINLKDRDIVNMTTAQIAQSPVLLVADIDRGGVFASIIGTLELLTPAERELVAGLIINKFRGDLDLLKPGLSFLEQRTQKPVLGVIPYLHDHGVDQEDSVALEHRELQEQGEGPVEVAVIQLPRISNFTDLNALKRVPELSVRYVKPGEALGDPDAVILPGTKNTILDLLYLKEQGYDRQIKDLAARGKLITGICGGYQMLGRVLHDPLGSEAGVGSVEGLGLLGVETVFSPEKTTHQVKAAVEACGDWLAELQGRELKGYEIHTGLVTYLNGARPLLKIVSRSGQPAEVADGAIESNVFGTHLHGLFDNQAILLAWVNALRRGRGLASLKAKDLKGPDREEVYGNLAAIVRQNLDLPRLYQIMGLEPR